METPLRFLHAGGCVPLAAGSGPRYTAHRAATPPDFDGRLAAACWRDAPRASRFVDLVTGEDVALDTEAAILWNDESVSVGFRLEEPDLTATPAERDAHIWLDDGVDFRHPRGLGPTPAG